MRPNPDSPALTALRDQIDGGELRLGNLREQMSRRDRLDAQQRARYARSLDLSGQPHRDDLRALRMWERDHGRIGRARADARERRAAWWQHFRPLAYEIAYALLWAAVGAVAARLWSAV